MNEFWKNFSALFKVKTVVTFVVMSIFCKLSLEGAFEPQSILQIVTMVVAFYFGTQSEKKQ